MTWRKNEETPQKKQGVSSEAELNLACASAETAYCCLCSNWDWFVAPQKNLPGNPGCRLTSIICRVEQN